MEDFVTSEYRKIDAFIVGNTEYGVEGKRLTQRSTDGEKVIYRVYAFELLQEGTVKERTTIVYKGKDHSEAVRIFKKLEEEPKGL